MATLSSGDLDAIKAEAESLRTQLREMRSKYRHEFTENVRLATQLRAAQATIGAAKRRHQRTDPSSTWGCTCGRILCADLAALGGAA